MDEKLKFGIYALIIVFFQVFLKITGAMITGSLSFLSETADTIIDVFFVSLTLYSIRQSQKPPDEEHMFGHLKLDPMAALIQGIILVNLYILLIINSLTFLISQEDYIVQNPELGIYILMISFVIDIIFSRILIWKGKKSQSLALEIQGLNLFQDSMRVLIVLVSFIFALFGIYFIDIIFSIIIAIWVIIGALKLAKKGADELSDINPINIQRIEELKIKIFELDHVNAIYDIKVRSVGSIMYLEVELSVEDHISIVHAHEITKSIRILTQEFFPEKMVNSIIQMNPLSSESSMNEIVINLISSLKADFPDILDIKDINIFRAEEKQFISLIVVVNDLLSLTQSHDLCSQFEEELIKQTPGVFRIITHIESEKKVKITSEAHSCVNYNSEEIKLAVEKLLRSESEIKGFHAFEFWAVVDYCMIEMHLFFEGTKNISEIHEKITEIELKIRAGLEIDNLKKIIIHSEPLEERENENAEVSKSDVVIF